MLWDKELTSVVEYFNKYVKLIPNLKRESLRRLFSSENNIRMLQDMELYIKKWKDRIVLKDALVKEFSRISSITVHRRNGTVCAAVYNFFVYWIDTFSVFPVNSSRSLWKNESNDPWANLYASKNISHMNYIFKLKLRLNSS